MNCKPICYVYYKKCKNDIPLDPIRRLVNEPPPPEEPRRYRGLPWNTTVTDDNINVSEGFDIHYSYRDTTKEDFKPVKIFTRDGISYVSAPVNMVNLVKSIPVFVTYFFIPEDAINSLYEVRFTFTSFDPTRVQLWTIYFNQELVASFDDDFEGKFKTTLKQTRNEIRIIPRRLNVNKDDIITFKLQWL
jgi:hypothetical protein